MSYEYACKNPQQNVSKLNPAIHQMDYTMTNGVLLKESKVGLIFEIH